MLKRICALSRFPDLYKIWVLCGEKRVRSARVFVSEFEGRGTVAERSGAKRERRARGLPAARALRERADTTDKAPRGEPRKRSNFSPTAQKGFCGDSGDFSPLARAAARELGAHKLKTAAAA